VLLPFDVRPALSVRFRELADHFVDVLCCAGFGELELEGEVICTPHESHDCRDDCRSGSSASAASAILRAIRPKIAMWNGISTHQ